MAWLMVLEFENQNLEQYRCIRDLKSRGVCENTEPHLDNQDNMEKLLEMSNVELNKTKYYTVLN